MAEDEVSIKITDVKEKEFPIKWLIIGIGIFIFILIVIWLYKRR